MTTQLNSESLIAVLNVYFIQVKTIFSGNQLC